MRWWKLEDGLMALERFSLERPDLVMLDMTMEGMHGLDVLEKIRQMDSKAPGFGGFRRYSADHAGPVFQSRWNRVCLQAF